MASCLTRTLSLAYLRRQTVVTCQLSSWKSHSCKTSICAGTAASGSGKPDQHVHCRIKGPEPGYIATPILLVHTALTLAQERDTIKRVAGEGGVFTAGALFGETTLVDRLNKAGVSFEVL